MATAFISGYTPTERTRITRPSGMAQVLSTSGTIRYLDLGPQTRWKLDLHFGPMTEAERDTLEDWLVTNEKVEIDIVVATTTYRGYIDTTKGVRVMTARGGWLWELEFGFHGEKL